MKKMYPVTLLAEEDATAYVVMSEEEALIFERISNDVNTQTSKTGAYCGSICFNKDEGVSEVEFENKKNELLQPIEKRMQDLNFYINSNSRKDTEIKNAQIFTYKNLEQICCKVKKYEFGAGDIELYLANMLEEGKRVIEKKDDLCSQYLTEELKVWLKILKLEDENE